MATAPPVADTKKPAPQPAEKKDGPAAAGGQKAAGGAAKQGADKQGAQDKVTPQQRVDRMAVRAKLSVSEPGDAVEKEADQVAERVSRKVAEPAPAQKEDAAPAAGGAAKAGAAKPPRPQEQAAKQPIARTASGAVPALRQAASPNEAKDRQQQGAVGAAAARQDPNDTQSRIKQQLGQGESLPENLAPRLEQQFGHDFSNVRIHHDGQADVLSKELAAKAFTVGSDIFFASGQYQPGTPAGLQLLAHELTHVVQQKDSVPAVHRRVDPSLASTYVANASTPGAETALGTLQIPGVKSRHLPLYASLAAAGNLKRVKGYGRDGANQRSVWNSTIQVPEAAVRSQLTARSIAPPGNNTDKVAITLGGRNYKRTIPELQAMLKIPEWGRRGTRPANGFQVDHIVELQVSGQMGSGVGNSIENMELLDQPSNSSSGGQIRSGIYTRVDAYLATFTPRPDRGAFLRTTDVVFERVEANGGAGAPAGASAWWSKADIEGAEPLATAQPAPPTREGRPDEFILSSSAGGIEVGRFRHDPAVTTITPQGAAARRLAGMVIQSITLQDAGTGAAATVGSIQAQWDLPPDWQPADPNVTMSLAGDGDYRGYPARIPTPALEFRHLSPVAFDSVSADDGQLKAQGQLTPSLPIFGAPISVTLQGRDVTFSMDYSAGDLRLPIPGLSIDDSTVRLFYSSERGLGVGGQVFFSVARVGSGDLSASFSTGQGIGLEGAFNFDSRLFDRARVRAWWRQGEMGAEGTIGIDQPDKIKGIRSASLTVGVTGNDWSFTGNAALSVPGVSDATVSVRKTDQGMVFDGDVNLSSSALVRSGRIHVNATEQAEGYKLSATGTAQPNIPGVDSQLEVSYDDGAFTASFSGAYARGMMSGNVTVGVTNRSVDEQGNLGGLGDPDAPLVVYGSGSATMRIAPWLQGTAGIRFSPTGEVTVSGEIGLPGSIEMFPRQEINKSLFSLSTQIPIVPGIVAEVGGNLSAKAGIGPGVLDQLRIGIEYNPAHEENTHVTGDAHLNVPADAGLRLAARAGIGLGITGASATGGIELGGSLGIDGAAEAGVHVDWMPSQGLRIDANAAFHAEPKFKFDVSGYVAVTALGFSVYDQRWQLAAYELGSNMRFGVNFPVHYVEGEPFNVSMEDVEFEVPDVDPGALIGQLGEQIF
ncbi:DUF4157 domain-containing protein [Aquabacterium soli]|nr:DUF4157 domain-containing protein [Aquabacterium soli]